MPPTSADFSDPDFLNGARNPVITSAGRPIYYVCVPGDPLPKARTTQRGKWLDAKARRSLAYQDKVAQCARLVWRVPAFPETADIEIKCFFYRKTRRVVDRDNLMKSIQDGLERAGVVRRDDRIVRGSDVLYTGCPRPHVKIFLCEASPGRSLLALLGEPPEDALAASRAFLRLTGKPLAT
ncbi:RusA family crossover junction endodeoxyribonuclease [bacterium]|nr:RusA family crossover junction endodeoxyribonuclease [bacterium]